VRDFHLNVYRNSQGKNGSDNEFKHNFKHIFCITISIRSLHLYSRKPLNAPRSVSALSALIENAHAALSAVSISVRYFFCIRISCIFVAPALSPETPLPQWGIFQPNITASANVVFLWVVIILNFCFRLYFFFCPRLLHMVCCPFHFWRYRHFGLTFMSDSFLPSAEIFFLLIGLLGNYLNNILAVIAI